MTPRQFGQIQKHPSAHLVFIPHPSASIHPPHFSLFTIRPSFFFRPFPLFVPSGGFTTIHNDLFWHFLFCGHLDLWELFFVLDPPPLTRFSSIRFYDFGGFVRHFYFRPLGYQNLFVPLAQ